MFWCLFFFKIIQTKLKRNHTKALLSPHAILQKPQEKCFASSAYSPSPRMQTFSKQDGKHPGNDFPHSQIDFENWAIQNKTDVLSCPSAYAAGITTSPFQTEKKLSWPRQVFVPEEACLSLHLRPSPGRRHTRGGKEPPRREQSPGDRV